MDRRGRLLLHTENNAMRCALGFFAGNRSDADRRKKATRALTKNICSEKKQDAGKSGGKENGSDA